MLAAFFLALPLVLMTAVFATGLLLAIVRVQPRWAAIAQRGLSTLVKKTCMGEWAAEHDQTCPRWHEQRHLNGFDIHVRYCDGGKEADDGSEDG